MKINNRFRVYGLLGAILFISILYVGTGNFAYAATCTSGDPGNSVSDTLSGKFALICNPTETSGQLCQIDWCKQFTLNTASTVSLNFKVAETSDHIILNGASPTSNLANYCSAARIYAFVDNQQVGLSSYLGISPYSLSGAIFSNLTLSAGAHNIALRAEGTSGGCNAGNLYAWGGVLSGSISPQATTTTTSTCSSNSECGTNGLTGSPYCQGSGIYQNYRTYTCNNSGTANSYCSNATTQQLQNTCSGNQTCNGGSCSTVNTCTPHYSFRCAGNGVYWFDSCGNQQELYQACTGNQTCSGNTCINTYVPPIYITPTCTPHYSFRCAGNGVYWFDSCGNQQELYQACNGNQTCSGNTCVNQIINNYGNLSVTKTARNLSTGNLNWSNSVTANPSDILQFNITVQSTGNSYANNVTVRDILPSNLYYNNNLTIDGIANSGSIASGITVGSLSYGQTRTITYQTQVAPAQNFTFGTTTLVNSVTANSTDNYNNLGTSSASVIVTRSGVLGATTVSTGLTNDFWVDSFFLPLLLALVGVWAWKSGILNNFAIVGWVNGKKAKAADFSAQQKLQSKITAIKERETF